MRLMPDYTILIAYLIGVLIPLYGFTALGGRPTLYTKGIILFVGYVLACVLLKSAGRPEGFAAGSTDVSDTRCPDCGTRTPCPAYKEIEAPVCPPMPDMSKYVLKSSIPPCPSLPDMSNYMLKSECPPVPDMAQYVLKSSVPKQGPIIIDTSADNKAKCGDCPPCPRPRCPDVMCPPAPKCPVPAPCPRPVCPQQVVKCKAEDAAPSSRVRPFLAPLDFSSFG